jgi:hypothetical protein
MRCKARERERVKKKDCQWVGGEELRGDSEGGGRNTF